MAALNGWHIGERAVRRALQYDTNPALAHMYTAVGGDLPGDHAQFHSTRLPFLPVTTLDSEGRPWGSILAGEDGQIGFISNSKYTTLDVQAKVWEGEPLIRNAEEFGKKEGNTLVAGIGIEFPTRRRNKFAGFVSALEFSGEIYHLQLTVNQAIGNCPKYINSRELEPYPDTSPKVVYDVWKLAPGDHLPDDLVSFIHDSDTVFFGTTYQAPSEEADQYPSHVGMNQRGGRVGFIRVDPSDKRTVILPDYSGNRIMTSLGNVAATSLASMTFVSFTTGNILYLTGTAKNLFGKDAREIMTRQDTLTMLYVTGYTYVHDALPVRQKPNTSAHRSPYSPPIKPLVNEVSASSTTFSDGNPVPILLSKIQLHSATIATFTWTLPSDSEELRITPGQAAILDFTPLLGSVPYQHMSPHSPTSVNDDRIRTWTVSSFTSREFSLTMRLKVDGATTGALFSIAHKLAQVKPELLDDARGLGLTVRFLGVSGDFVLDRQRKKMLWIAGGIGVTPFLSFLRSIAEEEEEGWDIKFVLSTREPGVLLPLLPAVNNGRKRVEMGVFSSEKILYDGVAGEYMLRKYPHARLSSSFFNDLEDLGERSIYLCGPQPFERMISDGLVAMGVKPEDIKREGFEY